MWVDILLKDRESLASKNKEVRVPVPAPITAETEKWSIKLIWIFYSWTTHEKKKFFCCCCSYFQEHLLPPVSTWEKQKNHTHSSFSRQDTDIQKHRLVSCHHHHHWCTKRGSRKKKTKRTKLWTKFGNRKKAKSKR